MEDHNANEQANLDALLNQALPEEKGDLEALWALTGSVPEPGTTDPAAEARVWNALDALTQAPAVAPVETPAPDRPRLRRIRWQRGLRALAASILLGAVGLAWWMQPVTHTAPLGERLTVSLPDGSSVELNSGAKLRYPRRFKEQREVHLVGEAFFAVAHDDRPFIVETFNAQVEVLGTRFNVKAWPDGLAPVTTVSLESGRVALAALGQPEEAIEMEPGETRTIGLDVVFSPPDTLAIGRTLAWRTGALIYRDEMLGVVLEDIERRFGIALDLQVPELHRRRINLSMHQPTDAEAVIRNLCAAYALNYRATASGYTLYDPN